MSPRELLDCRLQSLGAEQDHQLRGAKFCERECRLLVLYHAAMLPTHAGQGGESRIAPRRTTSFCTNRCFCGHHMWVDKT
jgi:hypothetical protein